MEWITAEQAREKSIKSITEKTKLELTRIFTLINKAILEGKQEVCEEDLNTCPQTVEKLKELGYKVSFSSHRNESYTSIKW